ncbi:MAG: glycosyltransferase family 9 protein [Prevotella sp.]|nr:glycosyltransferase family 9 protein [Prevotella sp.]
MKKEHILIIRFSAMGDVAMLVPLVYSLAVQYPNIRITVLSRPFARTFFEDIAPNVCFMAADIKTEYRGIKGLNALYRRLTAKKFTAIADCHGVLRSRYLRMRFSLGRYKVAHIDKHRAGKRALTSNISKRLVQQPTSFKNYADVLAQLGYPVSLSFNSIFPPEGGNINLLPAAIGPRNSWEQWIGIAPFAAHEGKIYPPRLMSQVIDQLIDSHPRCRIFLFGRGKDEDRTFPEWCEAKPQCVFVARHLETMHQELILMSHLHVMVSMDSANMHLASLCATPVVSVWGATHPYAGFMGWGQSTDNIVQLDLPCRPCSVYGNKPCRRGDFACMRNIAPEAIVEKVNGIIDKLTHN